MTFSLTWLETLDAVSAHRGISRAAKALSISQSAATKHIQKLEDKLKCKLIEIKGREVLLTAFGENVLNQYRYARTQFDEIEALAAKENNLCSGKVVVGLNHSIHEELFRRVKEYQQQFPEISFDLVIGNRERMLAQLDQYRADFIVLAGAPGSRDYVSKPLINFSYDFIVNKNHPLAQKDSISVNDIKNQRLIFTEHHSMTDKLCLEVFKPIKDNNYITYISDTASFKTAIKLDMGVGILPSVSVDEFDAPFVKRVKLQELKFQSTYNVIYHRKKLLTKAAISLMDFLLEAGDS